MYSGWLVTSSSLSEQDSFTWAMGDEMRGPMNLDLNLGPLTPPSPSREQRSDSGSVSGQPVISDRWAEGRPSSRRLPDAVRPRARPNWRWQQVPIPPETRNISMELVGNFAEVNGPQTGEGSDPAEERTDEPSKACENNNGDPGHVAVGKKEDIEKGSGNDGSFFDCNICLDLASDPVVTCCGHLFCWPCLFRWLDVHSDAKECPVCKGEVTVKNVTPIYGRGINTHEAEVDLGFKIPVRPQAQRVESLRQSIQRSSFSSSMEEMFRRLGTAFDFTQGILPPQDLDSGRETVERNPSQRRIVIPRRLRREPNIAARPDNVADLNQSSTAYRPTSLLRRSPTNRGFTMPVLNSPQPVVERYLRGHLVGRNQEQPASVDDRDSFSSIGAVIHSGSQTMDTAVEIDSTVSLSTSSSGRRTNVSRTSDVDSGESPAPRRRRLN